MNDDVTRKPSFDAAESQTPSMCGNSMRENRETQATPLPDGGGGRSGKTKRRTPDVDVAGESDGPIVPAKRANKAEASARSRYCDTRERKGEPTGNTNIDLNRTEDAAESVEERGSTKGNAMQTAAYRTQGRESATNGLHRVRAAARRDKEARFTALLHHVTPQSLRASFYELKRSASPGVDGVTWKEYETDLEGRIPDLHERIHRGTYRAKPSKRAWIPKADGRRRPLGIAALEDKIVQQAVRTILEAIYVFLHYVFDFLGFTHYCGKNRAGNFKLKRKTITRRLRATLQKVKLELRRRMHLPVDVVGRWLRSVVQGWYNYHAVPDNRDGLEAFRTQVSRYWLHVVRRRSQKGRKKWTWDRMRRRLIRRWIPSVRILHPYPDQRLIVTNPR